MLAAIAITATSLVLLLDAMARRGTFRIGIHVASRPPVGETVTFVTPRPIVPSHTPVPRTIAPRTRTQTPPSTRSLEPPVGRVDSGTTLAPVVPERREPGGTPPRVPALPSPFGMRIERDGWTTPRPLAPLPGIVGATPPREPLTNERVDSILDASAIGFAEAARRRVPTAAEMDERRRSADLDQRLRGRPGLPESAMRGSMSMPSLPGTRARREREAAVEAESRARLRRLVERAKAKRDSMWRADSIARSISVDPK
jgi:hypothetical protein